LECANGNVIRITEIQFRTYLSYNLLREYLKILIENDLLEYIEGERSFKTTPKGMHYLEVYNRMGELVVQNTFGKRTKNVRA